MRMTVPRLRVTLVRERRRLPSHMQDRLLRLVRRTRGLLPGFLGPPPHDTDPWSYVRQPRSSRPGGRDTSIALEEPEEDGEVMAVGRKWPAR